MSARLVTTSVRRPLRRSAARRAGRVAAAVLAVVLAGGAVVATRDAGTPAGGADDALDLAVAAPNPVTPGDFRGYGFDQCLTPEQWKMDRWLEHSPFLAVGVYTSGNSRACRHQPNLTATWVRNQLARGWKILPITLGPQSTCVGRFPRYGARIDPTISENPYRTYRAARIQAQSEADKAVNAAKALGIVPGSTLWYDLEGWSNWRDAACRESALFFLTAWTRRLHRLGYVSGVYSSAGSGMRILDDARVQRKAGFTAPDQIWIARWDGKANTAVSTEYMEPTGWLPGRRMKQYRGGHDETWGGVRINIDSNYLDLGTPTTVPAESHCGGVRVDLPSYPALVPPVAGGDPDPAPVRALQCLLKEAGYYGGHITGNFNRRTLAAAQEWRRDHGKQAGTRWTRSDWITLHVRGPQRMLKFGSRGPEVRRLQRALQTALPSTRIPATGYLDSATARAVLAYKRAVGVSARMWVVDRATWAQLNRGQR